MAQAQTEDSPEVEWREVEGKEFEVPFDPETDRPYREQAVNRDDTVRGEFAAGLTQRCAYADCDGKDHEVIVEYEYTDLDTCPECGERHMGFENEAKKQKRKEKRQKRRERKRKDLNRIPAMTPDVDVPEMHDSFDRGPFWMVNSDKAKVPSDDLGQWRDRLEEIEEAALMLAKAAQLMQGGFATPEAAYKRFRQLNKAWNKTTYQTRCVVEGVSINEENYVIAEDE